MYRVGFPAWKIAAKLGMKMLIKVEVLHDRAAGVVVVTSPDLRGLVVEMPDTSSAEELHREINDCVCMLMEDALKSKPKAQPVTVWPGEFQPA